MYHIFLSFLSLGNRFLSLALRMLRQLAVWAVWVAAMTTTTMMMRYDGWMENMWCKYRWVQQSTNLLLCGSIAKKSNQHMYEEYK